MPAIPPCPPEVEEEFKKSVLVLRPGDAAKGKKIFKTCCCRCHKIGKNCIGPNLEGVYGRKCGTEPCYNYSKAMREKGVKWNDVTLDLFLKNPKEYVPGTKMMFCGKKKQQDRLDVIAFLKTLKRSGQAKSWIYSLFN